MHQIGDLADHIDKLTGLIGNLPGQQGVSEILCSRRS
jgi:hypothetical protein